MQKNTGYGWSFPENARYWDDLWTEEAYSGGNGNPGMIPAVAASGGVEEGIHARQAAKNLQL